MIPVTVPPWARLSVLFFVAIIGAQPAASRAADAPQMERGRGLYLQHCFYCHQADGQGSPGTFPALAKSDFLMADRVRAIRILCEGIGGEIVVNGEKYNGRMPVPVLDDAQAADVLTFVLNSWGNSAPAANAAEIKAVRAKSRFPTYEALLKAADFAPLPKPPKGWALREVARLPASPTRLASDGTGKVLYALALNGDVFRVDVATGNVRPLFRAKNYLDAKLGEAQALGMTMDKKRRLYIVVNQQNEAERPVQCEVTIFRTTDEIGGDPFAPQSWLQTKYPFGHGPFNHGVNHIEVGPDGKLYVSSGARTDGNEKSSDPRFSSEGETPLTACLWRIDPDAAQPKIEIHARGLRNTYDFCWDDKGRIIGTENGPNADAPEELNVIEPGGHYGFPFQFADWKNKPYPHTPATPVNLKITLPVLNLGPAAGGSPQQAMSTFDPHSSPSGVVWLDNQFPVGWRGTVLVARYGNMATLEKDAGFDLLQARLEMKGGRWQSSFTTVLAPLARPIDLHLGPGKVFIAEYTRTTDQKSGLPMLSGRILEMSVQK